VGCKAANRGLRPGAGAGRRGRQTTSPAANQEHICMANNFDFLCRFGYVPFCGMRFRVKGGMGQHT